MDTPQPYTTSYSRARSKLRPRTQPTDRTPTAIRHQGRNGPSSRPRVHNASPRTAHGGLPPAPRLGRDPRTPSYTTFTYHRRPNVPDHRPGRNPTPRHPHTQLHPHPPADTPTRKTAHTHTSFLRDASHVTPTQPHPDCPYPCFPGDRHPHPRVPTPAQHC